MIRSLGGMTLVALIVAPTALGGSLNPPAGPIESTGRFGPRTELSQATTPGDATSVFVIDSPGSYVLAGNVVGEVGKSGIRIVASDVSLDLNGFGVLGAPGATIGIVAGTSLESLVIRGGTISHWPDGAALLDARGARLEDIHVHNNGNGGILVGQNAVLTRCTAHSNNATAFLVGDGSIVDRCIAADNQGEGFVLAGEARVMDCAAFENALDGFSSFADRGVITGCLSHSNAGDGFDVGIEWRLSECSALDNDFVGIRVGFFGVIDRCLAISNGFPNLSGAGVGADRGVGPGIGDGVFGGERITVTNSVCSANLGSGIQVEGGSRIMGCEASSNTVGITVSGLTTVERCVATINTSWGISVLGSGTVVEACAAYANQNSGIRVLGESCRVMSNIAHDNGLAGALNDEAGILIDSNRCYVDSNVVGSGPVSIHLLGGSNLVVRNLYRPDPMIGDGMNPPPVNFFATATTNPDTAGPWGNIQNP